MIFNRRQYSFFINVRLKSDIKNYTMRLPKLAFSCILLILVLQSSFLKATEFICGNIRYEYINQDGIDYTYKIIVEMYKDCDIAAIPFDTTINLGIYHAFYNLKSSTIHLKLSSEEFVDPSDLFPEGWKPKLCISKACYVDTIHLPSSLFGYHIYYQRCCKVPYANLTRLSGMSLYQFIPPNPILNCSPRLRNYPLLLTCLSFPGKYPIEIIDKEGDSIVYSLSKPWMGASYYKQKPDPPASIMLPLKEIQFASAYSPHEPFGKNSYSIIDTASRLINIYCPYEGYHSMTIDVKEYRQNMLISHTRFDIGIISLDCPPWRLHLKNPIKNKFEVHAGDSIGIEFIVNSNINFHLLGSGSVFGKSDTSFKPPFAYMDSIYGSGDVVSVFSWKTSCKQGREEPYVFRIEAISDDSIISTNTIHEEFEISVIPFSKPETILGSGNSCVKEKGVLYAIPELTNWSNVVWDIEGGAIISGQNSDSLYVKWGQTAPWSVNILNTSKFSCGNDSLKMLVNVLP